MAFRGLFLWIIFQVFYYFHHSNGMTIYHQRLKSVPPPPPPAPRGANRHYDNIRTPQAGWRRSTIYKHMPPIHSRMASTDSIKTNTTQFVLDRTITPVNVNGAAPKSWIRKHPVLSQTGVPTELHSDFHEASSPFQPLRTDGKDPLNVRRVFMTEVSRRNGTHPDVLNTFAPLANTGGRMRHSSVYALLRHPGDIHHPNTDRVSHKSSTHDVVTRIDKTTTIQRNRNLYSVNSTGLPVSYNEQPIANPLGTHFATALPDVGHRDASLAIPSRYETITSPDPPWTASVQDDIRSTDTSLANSQRREYAQPASNSHQLGEVLSYRSEPPETYMLVQDPRTTNRQRIVLTGNEHSQRIRIADRRPFINHPEINTNNGPHTQQRHIFLGSVNSETVSFPLNTDSQTTMGGQQPTMHPTSVSHISHAYSSGNVYSGSFSIDSVPVTGQQETAYQTYSEMPDVAFQTLTAAHSPTTTGAQTPYQYTRSAGHASTGPLNIRTTSHAGELVDNRQGVREHINADSVSTQSGIASTYTQPTFASTNQAKRQPIILSVKRNVDGTSTFTVADPYVVDIGKLLLLLDQHQTSSVVQSTTSYQPNKSQLQPDYVPIAGKTHNLAQDRTQSDAYSSSGGKRLVEVVQSSSDTGTKSASYVNDRRQSIGESQQISAYSGTQSVDTVSVQHRRMPYYEVRSAKDHLYAEPSTIINRQQNGTPRGILPSSPRGDHISMDSNRDNQRSNLQMQNAAATSPVSSKGLVMYPTERPLIQTANQHRRPPHIVPGLNPTSSQLHQIVQIKNKRLPKAELPANTQSSSPSDQISPESRNLNVSDSTSKTESAPLSLSELIPSDTIPGASPEGYAYWKITTASSDPLYDTNGQPTEHFMEFINANPVFKNPLTEPLMSPPTPLPPPLTTITTTRIKPPIQIIRENPNIVQHENFRPFSVMVDLVKLLSNGNISQPREHTYSMLSSILSNPHVSAGNIPSGSINSDSGIPINSVLRNPVNSVPSIPVHIGHIIPVINSAPNILENNAGIDPPVNNVRRDPSVNNVLITTVYNGLRNPVSSAPSYPVDRTSSNPLSRGSSNWTNNVSSTPVKNAPSNPTNIINSVQNNPTINNAPNHPMNLANPNAYVSSSSINIDTSSPLNYSPTNMVKGTVEHNGQRRQWVRARIGVMRNTTNSIHRATINTVPYNPIGTYAPMSAAPAMQINNQQHNMTRLRNPISVHFRATQVSSVTEDTVAITKGPMNQLVAPKIGNILRPKIHLTSTAQTGGSQAVPPHFLRTFPSFDTPQALADRMIMISALQSLECVTLTSAFNMDMPEFTPLNCANACLPIQRCINVGSIGFCCPAYAEEDQDLSLVKGKPHEITFFTGDRIPTFKEQSVDSFGRLYSVLLWTNKDKQPGRLIISQQLYSTVIDKGNGK